MSVFDMKILAPLAILTCGIIAAWIYVQREYDYYRSIGA